MNKHWRIFTRIHQEKPEIYKEFKKASFELINAGVPRYSAYGIMHVVRFLTIQTMLPGEDFKINNNVIPFYARLFVREYPQHKNFFKLHVLPTQKFKPEWLDKFAKGAYVT